MKQPIKTIPTQQPDEEDSALADEMIDRFAMVTREYLDQGQYNPRYILASASAASAAFSGIMGGQMIAVGDLPDTPDQRSAMRKAAQFNYDAGLDVGIKDVSDALAKAGLN